MSSADFTTALPLPSYASLRGGDNTPAVTQAVPQSCHSSRATELSLKLCHRAVARLPQLAWGVPQLPPLSSTRLMDETECGSWGRLPSRGAQQGMRAQCPLQRVLARSLVRHTEAYLWGVTEWGWVVGSW